MGPWPHKAACLRLMTTSALSFVIYSRLQSAVTLGPSHTYAHKYASLLCSCYKSLFLGKRGSSAVGWASTLTPYKARQKNGLPGRRRRQEPGCKGDGESEGFYVSQEERRDVFVPDTSREWEEKYGEAGEKGKSCEASRAVGALDWMRSFNPPRSPGSLSFRVQLDYTNNDARLLQGAGRVRASHRKCLLTPAAGLGIRFWVIVWALAAVHY